MPNKKAYTLQVNVSCTKRRIMGQKRGNGILWTNGCVLQVQVNIFYDFSMKVKYSKKFTKCRIKKLTLYKWTLVVQKEGLWDKKEGMVFCEPMGVFYKCK